MDDPIQYEQDGTEENTPVSDEGGDEGFSAKVKKLKDALTQCEALQKEYLDGWQRAKADYVNYKKDEGRRFQAAGQSILEDISRDVLMVLDSFSLAKKYEMPKNVHEGISMIQAQLEDVLRKRGFSYISVKPGDTLNPELHESIGEIESEHPSGTIAEESQKGYKLHGRVLRPTRVKIAK